MRSPDEMDDRPTRPTQEQSAFYTLNTRLMRLGGCVFLFFWLLVCGFIGAVAICALIQFPPGVKVAGSPLLWTGVLIGSFVAAGIGVVFLLFWRGVLDRFASKLPIDTSTQLTDGDRLITASSGGRMETSLHVLLQFVTMGLGCGVGAVIYLFFLKDFVKTWILSELLLFVAMVAGAALARLVMWMIPAQCPKCGGPAYCQQINPITFQCRDCRHVHNTRIYINDDQ